MSEILYPTKFVIEPNLIQVENSVIFVYHNYCGE